MPRGVKNIKNTVAETMEANPVADTVGQSQPTETELLRQQNEALAKQLEAMQKQIEAMQKNPGSTVVMAKPGRNCGADLHRRRLPYQCAVLGGLRLFKRCGRLCRGPPQGVWRKVHDTGNPGLLNQRRLIVLNGLNEDERRRYNVDYKDGELLDMQMFDRLLDVGLERLKELFSKLCVEHKRMVATHFISSYQRGDNRISREKVEPLNDLSKSEDPKGMFPANSGEPEQGLMRPGGERIKIPALYAGAPAHELECRTQTGGGSYGPFDRHPRLFHQQQAYILRLSR